MVNTTSSSYLVVKKVFVLEPDENDERTRMHFEVKALKQLPDCNRIVKMLAYEHNLPKPGRGTAIFEYYPLGDLRDWRNTNFKERNWRPVPESFIWRFFIQVSYDCTYTAG